MSDKSQKLENKDVIKLLELDYKVCHEGYNSRDQMANGIFFKLIQLFWLYSVLIFFVHKYSYTIIDSDMIKPENAHLIACLVVGLAGFLSMFSLLLILESVSSCKTALRGRCSDIEEMLNDKAKVKDCKKVGLKYWHVIKYRHKFYFDGLIKGIPEKEPSDRCGLFLIMASRLLLFMWILIVLVMTNCNIS